MGAFGLVERLVCLSTLCYAAAAAESTGAQSLDVAAENQRLVERVSQLEAALANISALAAITV